MRSSALLALAAVLGMLVAAGGAFAQGLPEPSGFVNDFADLLAPDVEASLEQALRDLEQETTVELTVVTVSDLGGDSVEGYAVRLFERWGIGKKGTDNGVLLLVARDERRVRIEVGYGLEPYLTDSHAGRILDTEVMPDFRKDDYSLGIIKGARAIAQAINDSTYQPGSVRARPRFEQVTTSLADKLWLLFPLGAFSVYLLAYMARTKAIWLGGIWGAVVGGTLGWAIGGLLLIVLGVLAAGVLGLFLDAALSSAYRYQATSGRQTSWRHTRGGFSGAGRGGWTGGGGFGGFGGGRSGGGGASRGF
ncbi:MAG: TPM domain-containing protein [Chloroflexi bacterium]|nr:TPM domain-containing protein [Chloroflexota bacterium]